MKFKSIAAALATLLTPIACTSSWESPGPADSLCTLRPLVTDENHFTMEHSDSLDADWLDTYVYLDPIFEVVQPSVAGAPGSCTIERAKKSEIRNGERMDPGPFIGDFSNVRIKREGSSLFDLEPGDFVAVVAYAPKTSAQPYACVCTTPVFSVSEGTILVIVDELRK